jgi:metal-responsive CopG/Arc/MetJ family transcriptional regulator
MAKKLSVGGFRLDLGEPLAAQLTEFCENNFRKKTEVIREALATYFEEWAAEQEKKV